MIRFPRLFDAHASRQSTLDWHLRAVAPLAAAALGLLGCSQGSDCTPGSEGCQCATGAIVVACTEGFVCSEQKICVADPGVVAAPPTGVPVGNQPPGGAGAPAAVPSNAGPLPTDAPAPSSTGGAGPTPASGGMPNAPEPTPVPAMGGNPPMGTGGTPPTTGGAPTMSGGSTQTGGSTTMAGMGPVAEPEPGASTVANPCDGMGTDDCDPGCSPAENAGSAFMLCDASAAKTYDQAQVHCESHGMRLAKLDSLEQYQWLGSLVYPADNPNWVAGELGTRVWVGLTNQGDDTFAWEDGSPLEFVAWAPGEPSFMFEGAAENCVHYWNNPPDLYDILNDTDCSNVLPYACRVY